MNKKLIAIVLMLFVPFLITLLFTFFWNLPNFIMENIAGGERLIPSITVSIFWKIYGLFLFFQSIVLLYLLSFKD